MPYIGKQPQAGQFKKLDSITVVNNQAAYTMQYNSSNFKPATAEQLIVIVNGVVQAPGDAYTVSGSTITFSENLITGDTIDSIVALGEVANSVTPTDGSVDINKMSSSIMKDAGIRVNDNELTNDVTIAADERAMVSGDFKVSATLTVNGVLTIV